MQQGTPRRRRARPVADAPVDALLARADDLAKGWLLELIEQAPLDHAARILAGELAGSGPAVCEAVIRALASDSALGAIEPAGDLNELVSQVGRLAAASDLEDVSRAVDALMAVLWSAILSELRDPEAELVSELAQRLAHVIESVRRAGLARWRGPAAEARAPERRPAPDAAEPALAGVDADPAAGAKADAAAVNGNLDAVDVGDLGDVDEAGDAGDASDADVASALDRDEPADAPVHVRRLDESSGDHRIRSWPSLQSPPLRSPSVRSEALWVRAIDDEIERAERALAPLSLLLVELEEADRVLAVEDPREASMTFRRFAQAVRTVVRRQDILACESDSRAWIIARESDRRAAQALGARIEHAVRSAPPWRGAPMTVSVGVAVLGEDGHESATLMDAAEEARFAATAGGVGVHAAGAPDPRQPRAGGPKAVG
jgi:GGDEF domain-containing protein